MEKIILIIAAMEDVELDYLKMKLENLKELEYKGFRFFEGNIQSKKVVLCNSNIGLINSGIATTIAIEKYNPYYIINEGLAGGYTEDISRGEIVIGLDTINITSMEYIGNGNTLDDYKITTFLHGEKNRLIFQKADKKLVNDIRKNFKEYKLHFRYNSKRRHLE